MPKQVLVTGGTGALGHVLVERLAAAGERAVVASRGRPPSVTPHHATGTPTDWRIVDYTDPDDLAAAMDGVDTLAHCAQQLGGGKRSGERPIDRLLTAARAADVPHLLYISIVGVDRVPFGYYRSKLADERAIEASGVPYTILRTTQFHDLVRVLLSYTARSPVMPVFELPFQPIAVEEVAARLAELARGGAAGRAADMGGPRIHRMAELAATYLRHTGRRRARLPVRLPGRAFAAFRAGHHLTPEHAVGETTFEDYLRRHPDSGTLAYRAPHGTT